MKALRKIGFFTAFILPALVVAGFYLGGAWNFIALFFSFIFLPLVDQWMGIDTHNENEEEAKIKGEEFYYRFVTYIWTFVQMSFVIWGAYAICSGRITTAIEWTGFILSFALVTGGIGITVAHELGHKKSGLEKFYSKMLLMSVSYMHFYIEHNRGHHVQVATPADPATAKKNENFYSF